MKLTLNLTDELLVELLAGLHARKTILQGVAAHKKKREQTEPLAKVALIDALIASIEQRIR